MTEGRMTLLAIATLVACVVVVVVRAGTAPAATLRRQATTAERQQVAERIAADEATWIRDSTQNFPSDQWSQRDDFHALESRRIVDQAKNKGVRIEDALRAVDDDIHRRAARGDAAPDARNARAVPCKPRPFYD